MRRNLIAFLVLVLVSSSLSAATFDRVTETDILSRADLVVVATVSGSESRALGRGVVTDSRLAVEDVLKGVAPSGEIVVRQGGGIADGVILAIPGSPNYKPGTRVVAFLRARGDGTYYTTHMGLGKLRFVTPDTLQRDADDLVVPNESLFDARPAKEFIEAVRAGRPDTAPRMAMSAAVSEGIEPATTFSAGDYATKAGDGKAFRWRNGESSLPLDFKISGSQSGSSSAFTAGASAWENEPNTPIDIIDAGPASKTTFDPASGEPDFGTATSFDGDNDVIFAFTSSFPTSCSDASGCGYLWGQSGAANEHAYDGDTFHDIKEADILIKSSVTSSQINAILGHEMGHALGLRHSDVPYTPGDPTSSNALMRSVVSTTAGATLQQWDREAIAEMYGNGLPCAAVDITSHTPGGTVAYGATPTLSVTINAEATAPVTYKWYEGTDQNDTSNQVGSSQNFKTPAIKTEKSYWAEASNACGSDKTTGVITLTPEPCTPVTISTQPASTQIDSGKTAKLTVSASGSSDITYKWYQGTAPDTSTPAPGTNTSKSYTTPALTTSTNYWVKVKNDCGEVNSATATVQVGNQCLSPTATASATALTTQLLGSATMSVVAGGQAPFTYQWYEGLSGDTTNPIAGATTETYTGGPYNTAGTFNYWVQVTNTCPQNNVANSATIVVTVECVANPEKPQIFAPPTSPRSQSYQVTWTGNTLLSPTFELQEATNADFTLNVRSFTVAGLEQTIAAHTEITVDTRFYYRVRPVNVCTQQPGEFSRTQSTLVTVPQPPTSRTFQVAVPVGSTEPVTQDLFVDGFGASALPGDSFSVTSDAAFITFTPPSGPLPAGGVTVVMSASPADLDLGSSSASVTITRTQGPGKGGVGTNNTSTTTTVPFSMSLVTPVTPDPRTSGAPAGTLIIPAIAHVDRSDINTVFQSDIRIANISDQAIDYEVTYTPSQADGSQVGKMTNFSIPPTESYSFDDIVKIWFGSGVLGETGFGTLEIRPLNAPSPFSTVASSRTYAVTSSPTTGEIIGTLGQFIPALDLGQFITDVNVDSSSLISLQQIANGAEYRTNLGFVEGSGQAVSLLAKLVDSGNNLLAQAIVNLPPFGHSQTNLTQLSWLTSTGAATTAPSFEDGRLEVQVTSSTGLASAYASVLDNATQDPLMVFPEQASKISSTHYVLPGIADITGGSVFQSDVRIFNGGGEPVTLTMSFEPLSILSGAPRPPATQLTLQPGEVEVIDDILPTLWGINQTAGALLIDTPSNSSIVATGRTFSPVSTGGTNGQFIPAVTAADAVGLGERGLTILQLEQSPQYRTNLGLAEVTGQPVTVLVTAYNPNSKLSVSVPIDLDANEFFQQNAILGSMFGPDSNVYGARITVNVINGGGKVAAYGSVVDMRTSDPTYVPAQ